MNEWASKVDSLFTGYLQPSRFPGVIEAAYKISKDSLSYAIVLKDDNFEARRKVFWLLNRYWASPLCEVVPVRFQFVARDMINCFNTLIPVTG